MRACRLSLSIGLEADCNARIEWFSIYWAEEQLSLRNSAQRIIQWVNPQQLFMNQETWGFTRLPILTGAHSPQEVPLKDYLSGIGLWVRIGTLRGSQVVTQATWRLIISCAPERLYDLLIVIRPWIEMSLRPPVNPRKSVNNKRSTSLPISASYGFTESKTRNGEPSTER